MIERKIRYNMFTDIAEQERMRYRWIFAILNSATEIRRIREKIFEQLSPLSDLDEIIDYLVPHSRGIHCNIFAFSSEREHIESPLDIYANKKQFKKDRDLTEKIEFDMIPYIERLVGIG